MPTRREAKDDGEEITEICFDKHEIYVNLTRPSGTEQCHTHTKICFNRHLT